jgi:hypothetical protein
MPNQLESIVAADLQGVTGGSFARNFMLGYRLQQAWRNWRSGGKQPTPDPAGQPPQDNIQQK